MVKCKEKQQKDSMKPRKHQNSLQNTVLCIEFGSLLKNHSLKLKLWLIKWLLFKSTKNVFQIRTRSLCALNVYVNKEI